MTSLWERPSVGSSCCARIAMVCAAAAGLCVLAISHVSSAGPSRYVVFLGSTEQPDAATEAMSTSASATPAAVRRIMSGGYPCEPTVTRTRHLGSAPMAAVEPSPVADRYRGVAGAFTDRAVAVAPGDWDLPAPCEGWAAR